MALSTKTLSFLFLTIFLLSHRSQARDSQFFSKVTNDNNEKKTTTTTTVVNPNDNKKESEEPAFYPETQNDGYGLYGHESGQFSPSDTRNEEQHYTETNTNTQTNYEPYTTPVRGETVRGANFYATNSNDNDNKYTVQRQGMSDTRFLENGRYYHDVSNEKMTYNPNSYEEKSYDNNRNTNGNNFNSYDNSRNQNQNSNGFNSFDNKVIDYSNPKNWYNNRGNNNNNYYGNNANDNRYNTNNDNDNYYNTNANNNNDNYYNTNANNSNNDNFYGNNRNNDNNNNNKSFEGFQNEQEFQP